MGHAHGVRYTREQFIGATKLATASLLLPSCSLTLEDLLAAPRKPPPSPLTTPIPPTPADAASATALRNLRGHTAPVHTVRWSIDGLRLLSGSDDKTVRLWDVPTETVVGTRDGHEDYVRSVVASPTSPDTWAAGSYVEGATPLYFLTHHHRRVTSATQPLEPPGHHTHN